MRTGCWIRRTALQACIFGATIGATTTGGYEFMLGNASPDSGLPPQVWGKHLWEPGATLPVVIVENALWLRHFPTMDDVQRQVEAALSAWSRVETADIRWEVVRRSPAEGETPNRPGEIWVGNTDSRSAFAYVRYGRDAEGDEYILSCQAHLRIPPDADASEYNGFDEGTQWVLVHELGHCLGLGHAAGYATEHDWFQPEYTPSFWFISPVMARYDHQLEYTVTPDLVSNRTRNSLPLTADDRIGASLLRPGSGYRQATGEIWGNVLVEDERRAGAVLVMAHELDRAGRIVDVVTRETGRDGTFVFAGLPPGRYLLFVQRIRRPWLPLGDDWLTDVRSSIRGAPVLVLAGGRTGPITLTVRPGEELVR